MKRIAPSKRDPHVGILKGHYAFSDDPDERRDGLLMQSEHNLVSFAETLGSLGGESFLHNEESIRQKMQELYDLFMKEFNCYVSPIDDEGRFVLAMKPDCLKYDPTPAEERVEETADNQAAA